MWGLILSLFLGGGGGGGGGALLSLFLDTEELEEVCGEVSAGVGVDGGARSLD